MNEFFNNPGIGGVAFILLSVLGGALVKGYSGFGASMLWVASLSLRLPPHHVVPMVLLWEVSSSLQLLPEVWRKIEWRYLGWLFLGACIATPIGAYLLSILPSNSIRIGIGLIVFTGSYLIWRGYVWNGQPSPSAITIVGTAFGLLNGSTALGGPPVIMFFLATPAGAAVGRASIIAFFLATDALAALLQAATGVMSLTTVLAAALLLPAVGLGTWMGARHFITTEPEDFKRFSLILLMTLGILVLLRASI
jgi:uncharacterized membrane protein YfcA